MAYVIATSLTTENPRRWEKDLVTCNMGQMASKGAAMPSLDEAWLRYRQDMVSAQSWWTATLTPTSRTFNRERLRSSSSSVFLMGSTTLTV